MLRDEDFKQSKPTVKSERTRRVARSVATETRARVENNQYGKRSALAVGTETKRGKTARVLTWW